MHFTVVGSKGTAFRRETRNAARPRLVLGYCGMGQVILYLPSGRLVSLKGQYGLKDTSSITISGV